MTARRAPASGSGLEPFSAPTRAWFERTFGAPTPAQARGWPAIARGDNTIILAPTGSGKTLAAFLWALDRLLGSPPPAPERRCRVLYVSPLRALTYDIERNLRAPLAGIGIEAAGLGTTLSDVRVAVRTGDTSQGERRDIARKPPDILVTTPESLYLMLTSASRGLLASVEHVIVDEIHSVAAVKRGVHLALSLERLERVIQRAGGNAPQRIGLSATQRPLDEIARFLGGRRRSGVDWEARPVTVVDAGVRRQLDLTVTVPVEDMGTPGSAGASGAGPAEDPDPEARHSIWPAVAERLVDLVRDHRSTLVFVNSRRLAERLAARINEAAGEELARAHHGSIAADQRRDIEESLKSGRLPALVATSSLELGIDMGAIDLVVQVEAPASVASGLQRIGRAGHRVGEASKGLVIPKFRGDLLAAAGTSRLMMAGEVEHTRVPRNALDVLAQQIVAMVAIEEDMTVDEVAEVVWSAYPYCDLTRAALESVLDMLSGRYPSTELAELRPRINWDRMAGRLTPRPGARLVAVTSGGTIPERGLYGVFTPEGGRVGELDEEMVYESRPGETFVLGASTWRIEDIERDRVVVSPAPGVPGKMPFWHGDKAGRPVELGRELGRFARQVDGWSDERLAEECGMDAAAVANLRAYLAEEREATGGVLPTDRQLVVERFRDELGDWRICVLSPFGARVHAPWALAIESKVRDRLGLEVQAIWTDDGIVIRLPEADDCPPADLVVLEPDEVEELVLGAVGTSSVFAARFRENAARSLLLTRRRPGTRTPLWQLRQKAADLLAVTSRYESFPILLETYRECLADTFDVAALRQLMADVAARRVRVASVEVPAPSPFAASLAFGYVAAFMYEGDAPLAERRAQALTLDRAMLAELVGSDELRELIDPDALAGLEEELQRLGQFAVVGDTDGVHDLLRRLGDLSVEEVAERCAPHPGGGSAADVVTELVAARRALLVRVAGQPRVIAVEDAGRYRDALGVQPPVGVPEVFLEPVDDALAQLVRRFARTHGPFTAGEPADRLGVPMPLVEAVLSGLAVDGGLVRGGFRPGGTGTEWCEAGVLRQLRQRSLASLRREVEPTEAEALARFLPAWHGVGSDGRGLDRCLEVVTQLQGVALPASVLERDVLAVRVREYSPRLLDDLVAAGIVMWVGAGSLGRDDGRVMLLLRDSAPLLLPRLGWGSAERPAEELHDRVRSVLSERGAGFFTDLAPPSSMARGAENELLDALWDLVWSGEVTNDTFSVVRAAVGSRPGRAPGGRGGALKGSRGRGAGRLRAGSLSALGPPRAQGRWSLVRAEAAPDTAGSVTLAEVLLERHGVLTRESVRSEGVPGGFAAVYPVLKAMEESGRVRRGYFVAGLGGAQFAVPGAVDRLRSVREAVARSTDPWDDQGDDERRRAVLLAATDPANPYGAALAWPRRGPQRAAGAYVVLVDGVASLYLERGGRSLLALRSFDGQWEAAAVAALGRLVDEGRMSRLAVSQYEPELKGWLESADFVPTPRGLVRYA